MAVTDVERKDAEDALEWEREQLIEVTWGWLVARPQRADGVQWAQTLERFLDARDRVKASTAK